MTAARPGMPTAGPPLIVKNVGDLFGEGLRDIENMSRPASKRSFFRLPRLRLALNPSGLRIVACFHGAGHVRLCAGCGGDSGDGLQLKEVLVSSQIVARLVCHLTRNEEIHKRNERYPSWDCLSPVIWM